MSSMESNNLKTTSSSLMKSSKRNVVHSDTTFDVTTSNANTEMKTTDLVRHINSTVAMNYKSTQNLIYTSIKSKLEPTSFDKNTSRNRMIKTSDSTISIVEPLKAHAQTQSPSFAATTSSRAPWSELHRSVLKTKSIMRNTTTLQHLITQTFSLHRSTFFDHIITSNVEVEESTLQKRITQIEHEALATTQHRKMIITKKKMLDKRKTATPIHFVIETTKFNSKSIERTVIESTNTVEPQIATSNRQIRNHQTTLYRKDSTEKVAAASYDKVQRKQTSELVNDITTIDSQMTLTPSFWVKSTMLEQGTSKARLQPAENKNQPSTEVKATVKFTFARNTHHAAASTVILPLKTTMNEDTVTKLDDINPTTARAAVVTKAKLDIVEAKEKKLEDEHVKNPISTEAKMIVSSSTTSKPKTSTKKKLETSGKLIDVENGVTSSSLTSTKLNSSIRALKIEENMKFVTSRMASTKEAIHKTHKKKKEQNLNQDHINTTKSFASKDKTTSTKGDIPVTTVAQEVKRTIERNLDFATSLDPLMALLEEILPLNSSTTYSIDQNMIQYLQKEDQIKKHSIESTSKSVNVTMKRQTITRKPSIKVTTLENIDEHSSSTKHSTLHNINLKSKRILRPHVSTTQDLLMIMLDGILPLNNSTAYSIDPTMIKYLHKDVHKTSKSIQTTRKINYTARKATKHHKIKTSNQMIDIKPIENNSNMKVPELNLATLAVESNEKSFFIEYTTSTTNASSQSNDKLIDMIDTGNTARAIGSTENLWNWDINEIAKTTVQPNIDHLLDDFQEKTNNFKKDCNSSVEPSSTTKIKNLRTEVDKHREKSKFTSNSADVAELKSVSREPPIEESAGKSPRLNYLMPSMHIPTEYEKTNKKPLISKLLKKSYTELISSKSLIQTAALTSESSYMTEERSSKPAVQSLQTVPIGKPNLDSAASKLIAVSSNGEKRTRQLPSISIEKELSKSVAPHLEDQFSETDTPRISTEESKTNSLVKITKRDFETEATPKFRNATPRQDAEPMIPTNPNADRYDQAATIERNHNTEHNHQETTVERKPSSNIDDQPKVTDATVEIKAQNENQVESTVSIELRNKQENPTTRMNQGHRDPETSKPTLQATESESKSPQTGRRLPNLNDDELLATSILQSLGCIILCGCLTASLLLFAAMQDLSHERILHMGQEATLLLGHLLVLFFRHEEDKVRFFV